MRFRDLLQKLRLRLVQAEGERPADNVDGLAAAGSTAHSGDAHGLGASIAGEMPPGYVPSQQDDRPRH